MYASFKHQSTTNRNLIRALSKLRHRSLVLEASALLGVKQAHL
jgi:hypothetical protein